MAKRWLRCLVTGAREQGDKTENTQHAYSPRVAQEHAHCSVPPPEGLVGVLAPLLPHGPCLWRQFISGVLLLAILLLPFTAVLLGVFWPRRALRRELETVRLAI